MADSIRFIIMSLLRKKTLWGKNMIMMLSYFFQPYRNFFLREKVKKRLVRFLKDFAWGLVPLGLFLMSIIKTWRDFRVLPVKSKRVWIDILCNDHPLGLMFGITGIIVLLIGYYGCGGKEDIVKIVYPECGISHYSQLAIDEQANSDESVFLPKTEMILAPEILVGFDGGVKAIKYEEIKMIRVVKKKSNAIEAKELGPFFNLIIIKTNNDFCMYMAKVGKEEEEFKDEIDLICDRIRKDNEDFPSVEVVRNRI